jgi:hypothetical protein
MPHAMLAAADPNTQFFIQVKSTAATWSMASAKLYAWEWQMLRCTGIMTGTIADPFFAN